MLDGLGKLAFGILLGLSLGVPVEAGDMPLGLTTPAGCVLDEDGEGSWSCDYRTAEGKSRRFLVSYQEVRLEQSVVAGLRELDRTSLRLIMESEIEKIDARRAEAAESGGDHDRLRYGFLSPAEVPDGFLACAEMRDVMVLDGSDIRNDRFHLHCWNLNPKAGTAVQALISIIEFNPLDVPVSSALQEDYTRLRETF